MDQSSTKSRWPTFERALTPYCCSCCRTGWKEWLSNKSPRGAGKPHKKHSSDVRQAAGSISAAVHSHVPEANSHSEHHTGTPTAGDDASSTQSSLAYVRHQLPRLK